MQARTTAVGKTATVELHLPPMAVHRNGLGYDEAIDVEGGSLNDDMREGREDCSCKRTATARGAKSDPIWRVDDQERVEACTASKVSVAVESAKVVSPTGAHHMNVELRCKVHTMLQHGRQVLEVRKVEWQRRSE